MRSSRTLRAMAARRRRAGSRIRDHAVGVATLISAAGPVEARSLRIRHDPNEATHGEPDIRRVVSDLSTRTVYLRIDTCGYSVIATDTSRPCSSTQAETGTGTASSRSSEEGMDTCVACREGDGIGTPVVGERRASRPLQRSVACALLRSWFPRIHRAVRFYAQTLNYDRAPNRGVYRWL